MAYRQWKVKPQMERMYLQQRHSIKHKHTKYEEFRTIIQEEMNSPTVTWGEIQGKTFCRREMKGWQGAKNWPAAGQARGTEGRGIKV